MKKISLLFALLLALMIANPARASIGIKIDGTAQPAATDLNFIGTGTTKQITNTYDGMTFSLVLAGVDNSGSGSVADTVANITDVGYPVIFKDIPAGISSGTLANGTPGQILQIIIGADAGGTYWNLQPTTRTGFTHLEFNDQDDMATLMYVDDTRGWIILSVSSVVIY